MPISTPKLETINEQWKYFNDTKNFSEKRSIKLLKSTWEYWVCGKGEKTLIFFHGAMIGPEMWFYPIDALKKEYSIIVPVIPLTLSSVAEVIDFYQRLITIEEIKHKTLIGYSYGGGLVQLLIDFLPEQIDRVVLTHTGLLWGRKEVPSPRLLKIFFKILPVSIVRRILKKKRIENYSDSPWNQFHRDYFSQRMDKLKKQTLYDYFDGATAFLNDYIGQEPEIKRFNGPVILMGTEGDKDAFYAMEKFREFFPDALEHVFMESGGHHYIFLHPEKYTQELYRLLKQTE
ncbi:MAG: alpha/beta fold hydrolase [Candidatus Thorarchaeota archaeon]